MCVDNFKFEKVNDVGVFYLSGDMDEEYARKFFEEAKSYIEKESPNLIVDMGDVNFISTNGIAALFTLSVNCKNKGGRFIIANLNKKISEIIKAVGIPEVIDMCSSVKEAISIIRGDNG